jgi:diguanylate cyclase (GGDEF)-like protein
VFRDLGRRDASGQKLARQLYRDAATGLYNRRGFGVRSTPLLEALADNPERAGGFVLYVEIVNLDQIERRHGVDAEHDALTRSAEVLHRALRLHDVVARLSRASFAALIALPPRYQPSYIATRVRAALTHVNRHARTPFEVELAIGMAPANPHEPLWEAVEHARGAAIGAAHRTELP